MERIFKDFKKTYETLLKSTSHQGDLYHLEGDVWTHTMLVFNQARLNNASKNLQIAALLHDIGKPLAKNHLENGKIVFRGHEGISTLMSIDFLINLVYKDTVSFLNAIEILYITNYHGIFWRKSDKQIKKYFVNGHYDLYEKLYEFSSYDAKGNISFKDFQYKEKEKYGFNKICNTILDKNCYIMIGLPGSGKSTYIKKNFKDLEVLSRDDILLEYGKKKGYGDTYTDIWKKLSSEDQKEINKILLQKFNKLKKSNKDFVIDMTNISWKSRRRWLSQLDDYNVKAVVMLSSLDEILKRNKERSEIDGKFIPENILIDFAKRFELPLYTEGFNRIYFEYMKDTTQCLFFHN